MWSNAINAMRQLPFGMHRLVKNMLDARATVCSFVRVHRNELPVLDQIVKELLIWRQVQ
jgi:hypothetical protein